MLVHKNIRTFVTLTTIPSRLEDTHYGEDGLAACLTSLCTQQYDNYEIHFNIPTHYNLHEGKEYVIPLWLAECEEKYPHLKIFRVEDIGPPTKIVPTLQRIEDKDAIIIVVDDDIVYDSLMVAEHIAHQRRLPNSAIGYDGLDVVERGRFNDIRDHFVTLMWEDTRVKVLQHYKSVSYKRSFFDNDFFSEFVGKTGSDDILLSAYMGKQGIHKIVVPYSGDGVYKDLEEWHARLPRHSFPMLRPIKAEPRQGTQDPQATGIFARFYRPDEFHDYLEV